MKITIARFINQIKNVLQEIEWGFQRMFRKYDDPTLWGYMYHFFDAVLPALKYMSREGQNSYPCDFKNFEEWECVLEIMIDGFEHGKKLSNNDFPFYDKLHSDEEYNNLTFDEHWGNDTSKVDEAYERYGGFEQLNKERDEYSDKFDKSMKLFVEHFWNLWD